MKCYNSRFVALSSFLLLCTSTSYVTAASSLAPSAAPSSAPSATTSSSPAAAAPSSSNSQYTSDTTFESSILNSTNTYRHLYNATSLTWNTTLASYASTYADKCIFAHSHGPYGENIAETYPNVTAAVEGWGGRGRSMIGEVRGLGGDWAFHAVGLEEDDECWLWEG
ncbi:hypothetical protein ABVK25_012190 [Lepraria finkii]|uniref:SCP domain-containing protein n=1 Tax=Lepraria finkii TaxID=1340010 RepID=A0ABR4AHX7_9LECA